MRQSVINTNMAMNNIHPYNHSYHTSELCLIVRQEGLLELEPRHLRLSREVAVKEGVFRRVHCLLKRAGALTA